MEGNIAGSLEFEFVLFSEDVNEGLGVLHRKRKVVYVNGDIFVDVAISAHPDVWFGHTWIESK
jgi:hypothetical protein